MPVLDLKETGLNIKEKMKEAGMTVVKLQDALGFNTPQAIYKWFRGDAMPTVDNLVILAVLFQTKVDDLLVVKMAA